MTVDAVASSAGSSSKQSQLTVKRTLNNTKKKWRRSVTRGRERRWWQWNHFHLQPCNQRRRRQWIRGSWKTRGIASRKRRANINLVSPCRQIKQRSNSFSQSNLICQEFIVWKSAADNCNKSMVERQCARKRKKRDLIDDWSKAKRIHHKKAAKESADWDEHDFQLRGRENREEQ